MRVSGATRQSFSLILLKQPVAVKSGLKIFPWKREKCAIHRRGVWQVGDGLIEGLGSSKGQSVVLLGASPTNDDWGGR